MSTPVVDKSDKQHVKAAAYMHPINPRDKMLYIFYVDIAKCYTLDINLINETILHLKHVLEKNYDIPVTKQVLLINGGECLADDTKICFYPAGTDTNPIFLFNRAFLESSSVQCYIPDLKNNVTIDNELNQLFDSIENLSAPVSLYTIEKGSQLAKKYVEQATEAKMLCDKINTDQLLQHQGFSAALANLDDVLRTFEGQLAAFDSSYNKYLETRAKNIDLIDRFSEDLALLSKIPILPALLDGNEEERARMETCCDKSKTNDVSLLEWISAKDPEQSLENTVEMSRAALARYDEHALVSLKDDINTLISADELSSVRNVSEIVEKLMNLQQICQRIKDLFNDQMSKSDGIQHNHRRISDLRDDSILPDLIAAHRDTLRAMKANHTNVRNCRFMCLQTKKELCDIIHKKLKAVMTIQERAAEIRSMLLLHGANMKRVRQYVEVVQQLHSTPKNYFSAVSEVVRRRSYSQAFLMWASDLACKIFTIYSEETERRKKFMAQFEGHFLECLFPGLKDMPSNFATQSPPIFDNNLPALCEDDLKQLCQHLPDLEECVQLPDVDSIRNFFLSKSLTLSEIEDEGAPKQKTNDDDRLAVVMSSSSNASKTQDLVVAMSYEDSSTREKKDDLEKESDRVKHENDMKTMRDGMAVLGTVAHNTVISLRNDLSALRSWVYSHQSEIIAVMQKLYSESQQQQSHIHTLLQKLHQKDDKIKSLYFKISTIETEKMDEESEEEKFEKRVNEVVAQQKAQIIKEITEELTIKHKKEMEALRQRFKLMTCTNMERSPSDTSLEKIERGDIIEYGAHEAAISQLKQDMQQQLNQAIANERYAYESKLEEEMRQINSQFKTEKESLEESIRRPLVEEFDKQLDMMKVRETSLLSELQRHKETIHTLTGHEGGSYSLINRIEELEREKTRLETELIKERTSKYSFGSQTSFNTDSCSSTSLTSTSSSPDMQQGRTRFKERIAYKKGAGVGSHRSSQSIKSRGSSSYLVPERISIQTKSLCLFYSRCNVGDPVLVVWDEIQRNYTILQNSNTHYFLHPSSIDKLGLRPASDGSPRKLYCPAEVVEKEYCAPKKTTNRYNLKEGERFYRVKVRPLATERTL
ncbi:RB1-inducible coiled-coil protein 1 isoform X2 [Planococcus citri]|uniref:RB1-inducible coiled-coil protein 1 isoform X2 n=1 Tax=Planococcus citri TaxID=170843 RepID=UPI0031F8D63E